MSILIKGVDMPKTQQGCMTIRIYYDGACVRHPQGTVIKGAEAVEVTTPHGRLLDGDALRDGIYHEAFETDSELQKWDSGCWVRYKMFENHMDNAPTIIEAEE